MVIDPTVKIQLIIMPFNNECYNLSSIIVRTIMTDDSRINSPTSGVLWHSWRWSHIFKEQAVEMAVAPCCLCHSPLQNLIHPKLTTVWCS